MVLASGCTSDVPGMLRPQRLLQDHDDFYIACDMMTNTYYICYKYLLMVDLDIKTSGSGLLESFKLGVNLSDCWSIYKSRGGYHCFLLNKRVPYGTEEQVNLMLKYNTDFYYVVYSYLRGYSVRLNKKKDESADIYEFVEMIGDVSNIDDKLLNLVNLHMDLTDTFSDEGFSLMS